MASGDSRNSRLGEDVGQPIDGYEILEQIGSGGAGSVYRAKQLSLGREVAIKVIRGDRVERETKLRRMEKEAQLLARLDHPNIVRSIDYGEAGDLIYFVMEFVKGRSAKQFLEQKQRMMVRDAIVLIERVAQALHVAAEHGVTHRDVKPGNILLGSDGSVKLSDFGLARAEFDRSLTRDGTTLGTPQYMSPEQVRHARSVDLRSDLYSLGATLYHLVTGQAPFHGESVAEILHEVLYGRPSPPERLVEDIPPALSRVIARLMARDPARRYQGVPSLLRDLHRVRRLLDPDAEADPDPIGLSWQAAAESPRAWSSRWPLIGAAAALVLLGAAIAFLVGGGGEETSVDPVEQEIAGLEEWRAELSPATALMILHQLDQLGDGSFSGAEVARVKLEQDASEAAQQFLEAAAKAATDAAERSLQRGELDAAEQLLHETFAARLSAAGEKASLSPVDLCGFDIEERGNSLLTKQVRRLWDLRSSVRKALLDEHIDSSEALRRSYGSATEGLLLDYRFAEADELRREFESSRVEQEAAAVRGVLARHGVSLGEGVKDLMAKLPESMRADFDGRAALLLRDLGDKREARFLELEARVKLAIDQAGRDVEALHWRDAEAMRSAEEWMQRLETSFPAAGVVALDADPDSEWRADLAAFEARMNERLTELRAARATAVLELALLGDDSSNGVLGALEERRPDRALVLLQSVEEADRAEHYAQWVQVVESLSQTIDGAWAWLEDRHDRDWSVQTTKGIGVKGRLDFRGRDRDPAFKVGRKRMSMIELPLEFLLGTRRNALSAEALALARLLWGGRADRSALEATLGALSVDSSVARYVRDRFEQEKMVAEGRQQELEDQARGLWASIAKLIEEERFDDAREAFEHLGAYRYRKTQVYRDHRAELEDLDDVIAFGKRQHEASQSLSGSYEHAAAFEIEGDGQAHVHYDFRSVAQGEDFSLTRGVRVANGRLGFLHAEGAAATNFGKAGPTLPLRVERRRPFTLRIHVTVPYEELEPPWFFGFELDGLCVGFYRPRSPRGSRYAPQASVWDGRLSERNGFFFDPGLESEPRQGVVPAAVGLEIQSHVITLDWDPARELPLQLLLDRALVASRHGSVKAEGRGILDLRACAPQSTIDRVDGSERLWITSIEFRGVLAQ